MAIQLHLAKRKHRE